FLRDYIGRHLEYTGSRQAARLLENWEEIIPLFVKVIPIEYRRALERIQENRNAESETTLMTEEVGD
ncbi:MAG: hypothetical protein SVR04_17140, partial [Spirochaetota bacterium]|nr:hypothetical protein [Spirochaetota bacterium]